MKRSSQNCITTVSIMSSMIPVADKTYPEAMASHEEVVKAPALFRDSLRSFHSEMGIKYMVPIIGGVELDLHVLYGQVTKRGGYDKVVAEKKWREISSMFSFSPTTTSASYALRKHYRSLLYYYEQVYFFRLQGSVLTPRAPVTFEATGTIEAKTDYCYLVSMKLGSETLNGVLYHHKHSESPNKESAMMPFDLNDKRKRRRERKRKRRMGPKPNRSGYNFYFADKHSELKRQCPEREREFTKMIGKSWTNLSQQEKNVYNEIGVKDKERYRKELREYKEKVKEQEEANKENGKSPEAQARD
ncbi:High mobility group B protein 9 [Heracleum sosnowskyi]|uniref:High mobility group B protein 9 n=1 Tax=Heracleum sosnowskyi TaxID=360622 RepID=A0AAD8IN96_9APIA|nr:High mobility group B protein 9 [Heracleum sosnowskyi]